MRLDMMTSEESMSESEDLVIIPLTWRSQMVTTFFKKLDDKSLELKSPQAKGQRKQETSQLIAAPRDRFQLDYQGGQ